MGELVTLIPSVIQLIEFIVKTLEKHPDAAKPEVQAELEKHKQALAVYK